MLFLVHFLESIMTGNFLTNVSVSQEHLSPVEQDAIICTFINPYALRL